MVVAFPVPVDNVAKQHHELQILPVEELDCVAQLPKAMRVETSSARRHRGVLRISHDAEPKQGRSLGRTHGGAEPGEWSGKGGSAAGVEQTAPSERVNGNLRHREEITFFMGVSKML